jgi:hypothetical protein
MKQADPRNGQVAVAAVVAAIGAIRSDIRRHQTSGTKPEKTTGIGVSLISTKLLEGPLSD